MSAKEKSPLVLPHERAVSPASFGSVDFEDDLSASFSVTDDFSRNPDDLQHEILSKFTPKKNSALELSQVYWKLGLTERSYRVSDCGSFLEFRISDSDADKRLTAANFCRDRLCPMCNWRRSLKIFGQVSAVMNVLERDNYSFLFLTLTVRNCSDVELPGTVQQLFDGWRKLSHKCAAFRRAVRGSFRSLEVTRNRSTGEFHPHLHVILAVDSDYFSSDNYISQAAWVDLWRDCCGLDYSPIVDIRKIKPGAKGLAGAVAEVSKYAVKAADYLVGSEDERLECVSAFLSSLTGRRLCSFTGVFNAVRRQLALDDVESGDLINVDPEALRPDVAYMIVRFSWRAGVYVRI